jgi:hypothetical protein
MLQKNSLRRLEWLAAAVISLVIAGGHFYFLARAGGFWRDEVNLLNVAHRGSVGEMTHDSFPVLMPLLVKFWSAVVPASSDAGFRLLGVSIGLATIAGLWFAAWVSGKSPPLISLVLFGLNFTVIVFGDSLRGYGLGSLLIVLTFAAACSFLKRPGWPRAGLLAVLAVLSVQALYHDAVLIGAICLGGTAVCIHRKKLIASLQIFAAGFAAAVSLLPYIPNFVSGDGSTAVLRSGNSWARFVWSLAEATGFPGGQFALVWGLLALAVIAMAVTAIFGKAPPAISGGGLSVEETRLFAGATLFVAAASFLGFLWLTALPDQQWYFLPLMALTAACFDAVFPTMLHSMRVGLVIGALATFMFAVPVERHALDYSYTNVDVWAVELKTEASPEDFVMVTPWFDGITFAHYYEGAAPWTTLPPIADHLTHRYDLLRAQMLTTNAIQTVLEKITRTRRDGQRVWLLCPAKYMNLLKQGVPRPEDLPPPPLPGSGWSPDPYEAMWTSQAVFLLVSHGQQIHQVDGGAGASHVGEDLDLLVTDGWSDTNQFSPHDAK